MFSLTPCIFLLLADELTLQDVGYSSFMTYNLIDMKGVGKSTVIFFLFLDLAELDIVLAVQE